MTLKENLKKHSAGLPIESIVRNYFEEITEIEKNILILNFLKIKEFIKNIHSKNKIENLTISLSLTDDIEGYEVTTSLHKKEKDEDCDIEYNNWDEIDLDEDFDIKPDTKGGWYIVDDLHIEKNENYHLDDEYSKIRKLEAKLIKEFSKLHARQANWFGDISSKTVFIHLDNKLPNLEEIFLSKELISKLEAATLENELIQNESKTSLKTTNRIKI